MLFDEVIDSWLKYKEKNVKESTFEQIEVIVRLHIRPFSAKKSAEN